MPAHHAPDELLIAYAAGVLGASESLLIASHLTLCPRCRALVAEAEAVGAALLANTDGAPGTGAAVSGTMPEALPESLGESLPDSLLDSVLARLDEPAPQAPAAAPRVDPSGLVPAPLFALVGNLDTAPWRRLAFGIQMLAVPTPGDDMFVKLFRFQPGARVPRHDHPGMETTLVLSGGFTDDGGHYLRGDVTVRDETRSHEQHIDAGEPCMWLVVADGRPIPRSLAGWFARIFLGL